MLQKQKRKTSYHLINLKCVFLLFLCLTLVIQNGAIAQAEPSTNSIWPTGPSVFAEAAIVMEASTGLILYSKNIDTAYYPASTTKILTTLVALENASLDETVTFSRDAVFDIDADSSRIGIDVGEQLSVQQCLYGIMLESANEVSYAIAEHISGSIDGFAQLMNEKAKSLGCKNSNFTNPHGLPNDNHYTTAYDLALITKAAMQNETFRKITATRTYSIPPTNIQPETRWLRNHHRFILKQDYRYDDCIGGKTGWTSKAQYALVSVAKRGDMELICVVMKDDSFEHQYTDTQQLFDYGFENFNIYNVASLDESGSGEGNNFFTKYNSLLSGTQSPISIDSKGYIILPNGVLLSDVKKDIRYNISPELNDGSNVIGTISYEYNGKYLGGANILYNTISSSPTLVKGYKDGEPSNTSSNIIVSSKADIRPIIIGIIVGSIAFLFLLYFVLVERPRLKRRRAYLKKRQNRKFRNYNDFDL